MTNLDVVTQICDILDELRATEDGTRHREQISFVDDRPGHDRRYAIDAGKIERDLGWRPVYVSLAQVVETWCHRIEEKHYSGVRLGLARA